MAEPLFWADHIAEMIINRNKYNYISNEYKLPKQIVIKSSTSISGVPHIGNAADVIRHDALVRALKEKGQDVRFIWVAEDMDALRKVPAGIPPEYKKYLGMPVADIPDPEGCCDNYSKHFCSKFIESLKENFGTDPEFLSTAEAYRKGFFSDYLNTVFENIDKIKEVLNKYRKVPLADDWNPWKPVCENCGRLITTKVTGREGNIVSYSCEDYQFKPFGKEAYTKLEGCGHKGESDITKGNGKLLWRVEWGMLWAAWKVSFEGAGKEHFMPGGAFWTAGEIGEKVLKWAEPYPGKNTLQPYEYLTVDGKKMSASVGNVVATWEWPEFALPQILRMIYLKKANKVRDFSFKDIPKYTDEFDELQKAYFGIKEVINVKELAQLKRLYEMSEVEIPKKFPVQIPFDYASLIAQIVPEENMLEKSMILLKSTGHVSDDLSEEDRQRIEYRLRLAKNWVNNYASEESKIRLLDKPPQLEILPEEKEVLQKVADQLESKEFGENELQSMFTEITKTSNIQAKRFFQLSYQLLIGKNFGPRLAPFILVIGQKEAAKRFRI